MKACRKADVDENDVSLENGTNKKEKLI